MAVKIKDHFTVL